MNHSRTNFSANIELVESSSMCDLMKQCYYYMTGIPGVSGNTQMVEG